MSKIYEGKSEVTGFEDGSPHARLRQVLDQWHEAHRVSFIKSGYTNMLPHFEQQEEKHAHIGAKYIRLDVGGSGAWMLEAETGIIYNIKGYGKVDKKKVAGDISDPTFDGAVLQRDRFRHGRYDNRRCDNVVARHGNVRLDDKLRVRTHPDEGVEKFNNGCKEGNHETIMGSEYCLKCGVAF